MRPAIVLLMALPLVGIVACNKLSDSVRPAPQEISEGVQAQFCGMTLTEHPGPKGQLFDRGQDTFVFTMPKNIAAIYVNDMGRVRNWHLEHAHHVPLSKDAALSEFERIAANIPSFACWRFRSPGLCVRKNLEDLN